MSKPQYPAAHRENRIETLHNTEVADPYRWLEDSELPETVSWSEAQTKLYSKIASGFSSHERFFSTIEKLVRVGVQGAPNWRGNRQFFMRRKPEQELAVLMTVDGAGVEKVLVDPIQLDAAGTTTLDAWQPSKEGTLMSYQVSVGGSEESELWVIETETGKVVDGPIDRARYSPVAWLPGGEAFYYVRRLAPGSIPADEEQYHRRVYLHKVGTDASNDVEIFGAGLTITNYYGVTVSRDGRWLQITTHEGTAPRNEVFWADLAGADISAPPLRKVFGDVDANADFHVGRDGRLYISTDLDAPMGRLCVADPEKPEMENWKDLISEDPTAVLQGTVTLDGPELEVAQLVVVRTRHTVSELSVHNANDGSFMRKLELPGAGTIGAVSEKPEGGNEIWFAYTDHVNPSRVFKYNATKDETTLWAEPPGAVEVPNVNTQQVVYKSKDGTDVRMFIISKNKNPEIPLPTILYGYGGFGVDLNPVYSPEILTWVEAGGVYAVANIRGGGEEGELWHRDGMMENKQNSFDDFIAAGEWLIANKWTTSKELGIEGGSNGGLLVGAVLTQRPDLFQAVICSAPLLDMVRYELHGLGATWNVEYGSALNPDQFPWLFAYSPYHAVKENVAYPSVLFTVFDGDSRVDPLHARKMCAALQHATTSERPILIRAEAEVGHGQRSVTRGIQLVADELAFMAAQLNLKIGA
jgi:prolyl oligopeptidase